MTNITSPTFRYIFKPRLSAPAPAIALALGLLTSGFLTLPANSLAQDANTEIASISDRLLFVTSGGFWEETTVIAEETPVEGNPKESADKTAVEPKPETDAEVTTEVAPEAAAEPANRRGYYRLVVTRSEDNTSKLFLQQVEIGAQGPSVALTTAVEKINVLDAYVTDVRREDSNDEPGFLAFVLLKTDLKLVEPDTWTVLVDEFGDITVEPATN